MTQTILKCNEIPVGKTYPVSDLRTAKSIEQLCEYVDAGHPIAYFDGFYAGVFRRFNGVYAFDFYNQNMQGLANDWHEPKFILDYIKLAPLACRNGRPMHVGDEIVVRTLGNRHDKMIMTITLLEDLPTMQWVFAEEMIK
jgi:hypothetical protein